MAGSPAPATPGWADYIVFLDSDDALRPGALAAALAARREHPGSFVLWHYTTDPQDAAPAAPAAAVYPPSALARLHLDCLIAMPWNKLYDAALAKTLRFDRQYSLGEDLQFVLDYIDLLQKSTPGWQFAVVDAPLTWYNCDTGGTSLSTRYHGDYCDIWPRHFAKLNAACAALGVPAGDLLPLHRAQLTVLAEGIADILRRDPAPMGQRRDKAAAALRGPWLRELLRTMRAEKNYSPYYLPVWPRQSAPAARCTAGWTGWAITCFWAAAGGSDAGGSRNKGGRTPRRRALPCKKGRPARGAARHAGGGRAHLRGRPVPAASNFWKRQKYLKKALTFCSGCSIVYRHQTRELLCGQLNIAEWSSPVARRAHNPKAVGSNPASATTLIGRFTCRPIFLFCRPKTAF